MSDNYEGKDGLERDIAKLKFEQKRIASALKDSAIKRFKQSPTFHNATNVLVESARISAYYVGHVAMLSLCLNLFLIGFVIAVLVN